jgi:hypothetical protein
MQSQAKSSYYRLCRSKNDAVTVFQYEKTCCIAFALCSIGTENYECYCCGARIQHSGGSPSEV